MTKDELHQIRKQRWPVLGQGGLPAFLAAAGYATLVPDAPWEVPALENLAPPEAAALLPAEIEAGIRARAICEVHVFGPPLVYMPAELFVDAYLCRAGRLPSARRGREAGAGRAAQPPQLTGISPLAAAIAELLWAGQPLSASGLRTAIGPQRTSTLAILAAGRELARELQILRIGGSPADPLWAPVVSALPETHGALEQTSRDRAAAALISKYLWLMAAATEDDIAGFFGPLFSSGRLRGLLHALSTAGVIHATEIDGRSAFALAAAETV